jgi:hypothetical protein
MKWFKFSDDTWADLDYARQIWIDPKDDNGLYRVKISLMNGQYVESLRAGSYQSYDEAKERLEEVMKFIFESERPASPGDFHFGTVPNIKIWNGFQDDYPIPGRIVEILEGDDNTFKINFTCGEMIKFAHERRYISFPLKGWRYA